MDSRLGRASILVDELALRLACCVILCQVRGSTVMRASSLMYLKEAEMSSARAKVGKRVYCGRWQQHHWAQGRRPGWTQQRRQVHGYSWVQSWVLQVMQLTLYQHSRLSGALCVADLRAQRECTVGRGSLKCEV
jgi:hypothetical protein